MPVPPLTFLHGPDRSPFEVLEDGTIVCRSRPFFGVISRGLLDSIGDSPMGRTWAHWCPWLDPALTGVAEAIAQVPHKALHAARAAHVLRFGDSAAAAARFIRAQLDEVLSRVQPGFD